MNAADGFLEDIIAHTYDDTPRLIYADWLTEHGQAERAEFIRLQVALAQRAARDLEADEPQPPDKPGRKKPADHPEVTTRRVKSLERAHGTRWRREAPEWARSRCGFRRGFVAHVKCSGGQWLLNAAQLRKQTPLESVQLTANGRLLLDVLAGPGLDGLTGLLLHSCQLKTDDVRRIAGSPRLAPLTFLHLSQKNFGDGAVFDLAATRYLTHLIELQLTHNQISEDGARALAGVPNLASLRILLLNDNRIGPVGAEALATSPHLAGLRILHLAHNPIGLGGGVALAQSPYLIRLTELDLTDCRIGTEGARALAESPHSARLTTLKLSSNQIGTEGGHALANSPHLNGLLILEVASNPLGDASLAFGEALLWADQQKAVLMNEVEWLACDDPKRLLDFLGEQASDRKFRLFACACCRAMWQLLTEPASCEAVETAEQYADRGVRRKVLDGAATAAFQAHWRVGFATPAYEAAKSAYYAARSRKSHEPHQINAVGAWGGLPSERRGTVGRRLIQCIFGHPFHPAIVTPAWLSWNDRTIPKLAEAIYNERAFERLPVLGDALEEAGCGEPTILDHCRQPGEHALGCWVVDLLLRKK